MPVPDTEPEQANNSDVAVAQPGVGERQTDIFSLLCREGPMSRQDLHRRTGWRPNTVGTMVDQMIRGGLLREGEAVSSGPGRPARPLEIDPERRDVLGVMIGSEQVSSCRLNLHGQQLSPTRTRRVTGSSAVADAVKLLQSEDTSRLVAIGVSLPGLFDRSSRQLLMSSLSPSGEAASLEPLFEASPGVPIHLGNCTQNLAVRYALRSRSAPRGLLMLAHVRDGSVGAAALLDGRPVNGSVGSDWNLGHVRMPVDTERCYCGQLGCVERVFSTPFYAARRGRRDGDTLNDAISHYRGDDPALEELTELFAMAVGSGISQFAPHQFVLSTGFNESTQYLNHLCARIRANTMPVLADRFRLDLWDLPAVDFARAGAWLALGSLHGLASEPAIR